MICWHGIWRGAQLGGIVGEGMGEEAWFQAKSGWVEHAQRQSSHA